MHLALQLYEFSASVGALEGYVYRKKDVANLDMIALDVWTQNLQQAYGYLPEKTLDEIQPALDKSHTRAISSLKKLSKRMMSSCSGYMQWPKIYMTAHRIIFKKENGFKNK